MFTFSFGSAMAATSYSIDDYATALAAEKTAQVGYMNSAKAQYLNSLAVDDDGFVKKADGTSTAFMKAAYEAMADSFIEDATKAMDTAINTALNGDFPKDTPVDRTVVSKESVVSGYDLTTKAGMQAAVEGWSKGTLADETQAPLSKAYVEDKIKIDLTKYNSTDKDYTLEGEKVTAAEYVQAVVDTAKDDIKKADKADGDWNKIAGYKQALDNFNNRMKEVKTLDDEKYEEEIGAGTVEAAVEAYAKNALDKVSEALKTGTYGENKTLDTMGADDTANLQSVATGTLKAFWEADENDSKHVKGEFFGVAVADITKVTRTEVVAIVNAYKTAVAASKAPVKAYAKNNDGGVAYVSSVGKALTLFANAEAAVEKYADVVKYANNLKNTYEYGIKKYDDASVDQALKAAEQLVYDDMKTGKFGTPASYLEDAAKAENLTLEAQNYELQKFNKAVQDAAKKFYKEGTDARTPQVKVSYGENKTAEADLVYLCATYANESEWAEIARDAIKDLKDAQSYDEINTIMAKAAEDLGKLLKADDAKDVADAQKNYKDALANYMTLKYNLADKSVYKDNEIFVVALEQGEALIDEAVTVDGVKAAYEEAKALIDNVKTPDELKAAKEAVEKQIAALPYTAKLTEADKAAVRAAYEAYDAYMNMAGTTEIDSASKTMLRAKYDKVNELVAKAINEKAKDLNKKIADLGSSDADIAAKAALKADVDAVKAEADALTDEIKAVNKDYDGFLATATMVDVNKLPDLTQAVVDNVKIKLVNASKDGATYEQMKEAMDAYNALTDKQKYEMTAYALPLVKVLEQKLGMTVKSLKITARSTAKKGSITVKWSVVGEADVDGYQIWKSTKANKSYKKVFTTTKKTYKNTKGLKKGTRYYYKVRAYKVIDGKNVYSDWSNKANRKAK